MPRWCFLIILVALALPAARAAEPELLRDFFLTLPGQAEAGEPDGRSRAAAVAAAPEPVRPPVRPRPLHLTRPRLEYWGIAAWSWAAAAGVLATGLGLAGARAAKLAVQSESGLRFRHRRQALRALRAVVENAGDDSLSEATRWLAQWYGLPGGQDGQELAAALSDLDPAMAAAVAAWEAGRFAPAGGAAQAARVWRDFLRRWLRRGGRRQGCGGLASAGMPLAGVLSPADQAAVWNRLANLPQEVAASHPHGLPGWFSPEAALVMLAVALAGMLLFSRRRADGVRWRRRVLFAMLTLAAVLSAARLLVCHGQDQARLRRLAVVVRHEILRPAPGSSLEAGIHLAPGDVVEIVARRDGWHEVRFVRCRGWIPADAAILRRQWEAAE